MILPMNDSGWREYKQALSTTVANTARTRLLQDYEPFTKERLDLGRHAGAIPRADEPVYRWVRYKESYSPRLVRDTLDELIPKRSDRQDAGPHTLYDPMVGSGTSLLVAAERGLRGQGRHLAAVPPARRPGPAWPSRTTTQGNAGGRRRGGSAATRRGNCS